MYGKLNRRCPLQGAHAVRVCRGAAHQAVQPWALAWLEQARPHKWPAGWITPAWLRGMYQGHTLPCARYHLVSSAAACLLQVANLWLCCN